MEREQADSDWFDDLRAKYQLPLSRDGAAREAWVADFRPLRQGLERLGYKQERLGEHGVDREAYRQYLLSEEWNLAKSRYVALYGRPACFVCDKHADDFHHRSYERLGEEDPDDLVPLCRKHHELVHDLHWHGRCSLFNAAALARARHHELWGEFKRGVAAEEGREISSQASDPFEGDVPF